MSIASFYIDNRLDPGKPWQLDRWISNNLEGGWRGGGYSGPPRATLLCKHKRGCRRNKEGKCQYFHPDNADSVKRRDAVLEEQRKKEDAVKVSPFGTVHAPPWCPDEVIYIGNGMSISNPCPDCEIEKSLLLERETLQPESYADVDVDAALEREEQELAHLMSLYEEEDSEYPVEVNESTSGGAPVESSLIEHDAVIVGVDVDAQHTCKKQRLD